VLIGLAEKQAKSLMTWRFADDVTALREVEQQNGVGILQTDLKFRAMKGTTGEIPLVKGIRIEQKKSRWDGFTRTNLLSSPTLPNRYVRPSHLRSSKATAETKEECPWHRAITRCSQGEKIVNKSS
jgi:hypothetical protein